LLKYQNEYVARTRFMPGYIDRRGLLVTGEQ
jgi:hypothetical protein